MQGLQNRIDFVRAETKRALEAAYGSERAADYMRTLEGYAPADARVSREIAQPKLEKELVAAIQDAINGGTSYGAATESMVLAAGAAFNYAASVNGVTGFQASYAALALYMSVMHIKSGITVLKLEDSLFPQYHQLEEAKEWLESNESRAYLRKEAKRLLKESKGQDYVNADVIAHWKKLSVWADTIK